MRPLDFRRTQAVLGVPPPTPKPIRKEFATLERTTPSGMAAAASTFLASYGINKVSQLGPTPCFFLLGEPMLDTTRGIVVSEVLNREVKGWGPILNAPANANNGVYKATSVSGGFYSNGATMRTSAFVKQYYIHKADEGRDFYDYLTGGVVDGGIVFNTHSPGFAQAVYHEILHTFEHENLKASTILKEGFVEWFADKFRRTKFGLTLPFYPAYKDYAVDVNHLIQYSSARSCAQAYFAGDTNVLGELMPMFYEPTYNTLPAQNRISSKARLEAVKCSVIKDRLPKNYNLNTTAAWYRQWVQQHNVPAGGLQPPVPIPVVQGMGGVPPPPPVHGGPPPPPPGGVPPPPPGGVPPPPPPPHQGN